MASVTQPRPAEAARICLELDRFEHGGDGRLEVTGRWFGVRGRRFIRPTLTLVTEGGQWRLLADLEHKPWSAEEGKRWEAAFTCELDSREVLEAELAVAPDITIALPSLAADSGSAERLLAVRPRQPAQAVDTQEHTVDALKGTARPTPASQLEVMRARLEAATAERDAARRELDDSRTEVDQLRGEVDRLRGEVDRLRGEVDRLRGDAASARKDAASALAQRDRALERLAEMTAEREEARQAAAQARRAHSEALRAHGQAINALNAAQLERDRALAEQAALAQASQRLLSERDEAMSARGAAIVMGNAIRAGRADYVWRQRAVAVVVVVVVLIALAIVLHLL
jgi:outer membrane murein-binding lipoprotein Lpp